MSCCSLNIHEEKHLIVIFIYIHLRANGEEIEDTKVDDEEISRVSKRN